MLCLVRAHLREARDRRTDTGDPRLEVFHFRRFDHLRTKHLYPEDSQLTLEEEDACFDRIKEFRHSLTFCPEGHQLQLQKKKCEREEGETWGEEDVCSACSQEMGPQIIEYHYILPTR